MTTLLTQKQTLELTTLSRTTLWRLRAAGTFPAAVKVSKGRLAWNKSDISQWMNINKEELACKKVLRAIKN